MLLPWLFSSGNLLNTQQNKNGDTKEMTIILIYAFMFLCAGFLFSKRSFASLKNYLKFNDILDFCKKTEDAYKIRM